MTSSGETFQLALDLIKVLLAKVEGVSLATIGE
jgi:hypothetical protein